jgi:hypothetical protein
MSSLLRSLLQPLQTCLLDLLDLISHEAQSRHVATHLGDGIGWQRHSLRCSQFDEALRCLAQSWLERSHPEPD